MIVKHLDDLKGTPAEVDTDGWTSRRFILKNDGMGYSVHDTVIKAGAELEMEYRNHLETVYCVEGEGELQDLGSGTTYPIRTGTLYALDKHDRHILRANRGVAMRMVCVFNPPLTGKEVHDASGAYPLGDEPAAAQPAAPPRARVADDPYPSRVSDRPARLERIEPVVYGRASDGPLTDDQLRFYEDNGYLSFEAFFGAAELEPVLAELERLRGDDGIRAAPEAVIEPGSGALRSVFAIHKHEGTLRQLAQHPRLVEIARQLLGSDVYVHQSRINYKSGFRGKEFYWHSDFETWHVEDGIPAMRMVSCSISLTPNTAHNGPLMLIPGSHRHFVACVGATPENHYRQSLKQQEYGVPDDESLARLAEEGGIVAPTGPAGSVTFFECNVMHGSNSNITPEPRSNVFLVFNSVHNTPVAPYCGLPPRPDFIAERADFTPISRTRSAA